MADYRHLTEDRPAAGGEAMRWMAAAVFLQSWGPVAVAVTVADVDPLAFQVWYMTALTLVYVGYIGATAPALLQQLSPLRWIVTRIPTAAGLRATVNGTGWAMFAAAARYLDTAVVTVLAGGWLVLFVVTRRRQARRRYRPLTGGEWVLLLAALAGGGLVTLSQTEAGILTEAAAEVLWGVALAGGAALAWAWLAYRFQLGTELHGLTAGGVGRGTLSRPVSSEVACVLAVSAVLNLPGVALAAAAAAVGGGSWGVSAPVGVVPAAVWAVAGGVVGGLGSVAFRHANLSTRTLTVNALQYLRPPLSLLWLAVLVGLTVARPTFLWVGAAAVVVSNALLHAAAFRDR